MSSQTYQVLEGTVNKGTDYERIFISTIILELVLDDDVQDFQLSSNDENFLPFDDVVIEIKRSKKVQKKLAIQLKLGGKPLSIQNLKGKNGEFSIKNYFERAKTHKLLKDFQMIIFTNRKCDKFNKSFTLEDENFAIKMTSCNMKLFCDHYHENGVSYKFESSDKKMSKDYGRFFKHFVLCCNQLNVNQMEQKLWQKFQQVFDCEKSVFTRFLNFITEWSKKKGTREKLNKAWIKEVIGIHLLLSFVQPVSSASDSSDNEKSNIFKKSIDSFDITIIEEKDSEQISEFWSIEKGFEEVSVQTVNKLKTKYQVISDYIKILDDLKREECSMILWLLDKCPLIIKYEKCIIKAIEFFKRKKFIILYNDSADKNFKGGFTNSKIFQNLTDLKENYSLYKQLTNTFHCSLQGKEEITLETLIDDNEEFEKQITTNDLFQFLSDNCEIGEKETIPETYINRSFTKHLIESSFLQRASEDNVIIICCFNSPIEDFSDFRLINIDINLDLCDQKMLKNGHHRRNLYISRHKCSHLKFEKICKIFGENFKYHQFKISNGNLEWIRSKNGIQDLEEFRIQTSFVDEKEMYKWTFFDRNITLVCSDAGLGKSISMKKFKNCSSPSFWTVLFYPKNHSKYFSQNEENVEKFEEYLLNDAKTKYEDFELKIFKILLKTNRVNYIWDGLDEVSEANLPSVLSIIKSLSKKCKQCLTARIHLKRDLEEEFSILSTTIKPFDKQQQQLYITERLKLEENELKNILSRINFKCNEILSTPLQIFMFTELFQGDYNSSFLQNSFSLIDLYEHFVDASFNIFFERANPEHNKAIKRINENFKNVQIKNYELAALKVHFVGKYFEYFAASDSFSTEIIDEDPVGIITSVSSEGGINFLHQSYSEYFAALYLSKNYEKLPKMSQFFFKNRFKNIRFMFDLILAKNNPVHTAVLYKNVKALKSYEENLLTTKDEGGRNPLHLACSWGVTYPPLVVHKERKFLKTRYQIQDVKKSSIKKENPEDRTILEYLAEHCNPVEEDQVYKLTSYSYADLTFGLQALDVLSQKNHKLPSKNLKIFENQPSVLYYSAVCNFCNLLDSIDEIPPLFNRNGDSILTIAATHNSLSTCRKLLQLNQKINAANSREQTPLHVAAKLGHCAVVHLLIQNGARINTMDDDGCTPLHLACKYEHLGVCKLLIQNGANVNALKRYNDDSLLHVASRAGNVDIVELLIEKRANINFCNKDGHTPLDVASNTGFNKTIKWVGDHRTEVIQKTIRYDLLLNVSLNYLRVVRLLKTHGARSAPKKKRKKGVPTAILIILVLFVFFLVHHYYVDFNSTKNISNVVSCIGYCGQKPV